MTCSICWIDHNVVSMRYLFLVSLLFLASSCFHVNTRTADATALLGNGAFEDVFPEPVADITETELPLPLEVRALLDEYPEKIVGFDGVFVYLADGDSIIFDLGRDLSHVERLASPDVRGMFYDVYPLGSLATPDFQFDPGRYRNEEMFLSMYGRSAAEVNTHLESVECFGATVPMTNVNGAADSLRAVIREAASYPHLQKYFDRPTSFYWRTVRGANRLSAHSFGIAVDIGVKYSNYWRWSNPGKDEDARIGYENNFPEELIKLFEGHGFISGARWYHYDTMHFEFRPEIIKYSMLVGKDDWASE